MLSVDVESTYNAILNLISNKMTVKLDVVGPLMENWVCCNMEDSLVVTKKQCSLWMLNLKILKQSKKPNEFTCCGGHGPVLCLG
jgi:hypothetical protein